MVNIFKKEAVGGHAAAHVLLLLILLLLLGSGIEINLLIYKSLNTKGQQEGETEATILLLSFFFLW